MKIKIVCLDKSIKFESENSLLINIKSNNESSERQVYKIGKNILESIYIDYKDYKKIMFKSDIIIILVNDINDKNIDKINDLKGEANCIIAIGRNNIQDEVIKEEFEKANNVIKINQLIMGERINLNLLMFIVENKDILKYIKLNKNSINVIFEKRNSIGEITIELLKQFGEIQYDKEYKFYLYSREEISLLELTYLEDPIREYISNDSKLLINNLVSEIIDDKSLYFISISK
ncbi:hypothetical protein [Clostridium sp. D53t1_180928_C8]|uniref:hypothetical protein n=1 Tax=Clostridium sp. D53t1_180928_C8 TaxID=2787101 RepID=UPI0018AC0B83|nr:hypothetical protein [Clostridium sp. D53t1_180928_C8]